MTEQRHPFNHPEVDEAELEPATQDTLKNLFKVLKSKAEAGFPEEIGASKPAFVNSLALSGTKNKVEVFLDPTDEQYPDEVAGIITKIQYPEDIPTTTGTVETRYVITGLSDVFNIRKDTDLGILPGEESRLLDEAIKAPELTEGEMQELVQRLSQMGPSFEELFEGDLDQQMGLDFVSEKEAKGLIDLIARGTPVP